MKETPRPCTAFAVAGSLAVAALLAALPALVHGQPGLRAERAELDLAADQSAYEPGETAHLAAVVTIEPGWHVNAHEPTFDYLIPTELTVEVPAGWPAAKIAYPEPVTRTFAFADQPLAVYKEQTVIVVTLAVPPSAVPRKASIAAKLRYQACDDRSCLPPVTTALPLDLTVGSGGAPIN